jgi:guanosine-3',5'-bis(diphosphate) 3'-pyrophosphohydrolase
MATLERAIEIAARAHAKQVDKAGQPYILHPLRVMLSMRSMHERMTAVLHDVVEDVPMTLEALSDEEFPQEVIEAVQALTKHDGESRFEAAKRAVRNPIARVVKLADVTDNMHLSRIAEPTEEDFTRLKVYEQVRQILLTADAD